MADILVARETFVAEHNGAPVVVHKGVTRVRAGHPIAEANPEMFEPVTVHYDTVEQATAAPGEARATRRPRKPEAIDG